MAVKILQSLLTHGEKTSKLKTAKAMWLSTAHSIS